MKAYAGVDVWIHVFLTSTPVSGEWSALHFGRFTLWEKAHGTHWIGGWAGLGTRSGLHGKEKNFPLPGLELRPLGRLARSQSLFYKFNL
jgi:hypothetical protein